MNVLPTPPIGRKGEACTLAAAMYRSNMAIACASCPSSANTTSIPLSPRLPETPRNVIGCAAVLRMGEQLVGVTRLNHLP